MKIFLANILFKALILKRSHKQIICYLYNCPRPFRILEDNHTGVGRHPCDIHVCISPDPLVNNLLNSENMATLPRWDHHLEAYLHQLWKIVKRLGSLHYTKTTDNRIIENLMLLINNFTIHLTKLLIVNSKLLIKCKNICLKNTLYIYKVFLCQCKQI